MQATATMKQAPLVSWRLVPAAVGVALIIAALAVLGWEVSLAAGDAGYRMLAAGEVWYHLDVGSLNLTQAVVQRYLVPSLWDGIVVMLQWPAWPMLAVVGALFLALSFMPRRRS